MVSVCPLAFCVHTNKVKELVMEATRCCISMSKSKISRSKNNSKDKYDVVSVTPLADDTLIPEVLEGKNFPVEKIPNVVKDCIFKLSDMQKKVDAAYDACVSSREDAENAASVKLAWWRIGDKSEAIEAMQTAVKNMAGSMVDQSDAVKAMFDYEAAIAKAMQFLLGIGVSSLAANRTVYKSLQTELRGASTEELSELARKELENTIEQLNTQQDLLFKQERTKEAVKKNKAAIIDNRTAIEGIKKVDQEQEQELKRQRDKDDEHDSRLDSLQKQIDKLKLELETIKGTTYFQGGKRYGGLWIGWLILVGIIAGLVYWFFR